MKRFAVEGMHCAACVSNIEKAVLKVPGVTDCAVNLLTRSMTVEGDASARKIAAAVKKAGYSATPLESDGSGESAGLPADETASYLKRFIFSAVFTLPLLYVSMGPMWGWPLPPFLNGNPAAQGLVQLLLSGAVMIINRQFFTGGFKSLFHASPNMDSLIALGSSAAFAYSTFALFSVTAAESRGDHTAAAELIHSFYFESAAMILTLISLGKTLEARSKGKATDAVRSLINLAPKTATLVKDGKESVIPADRLTAGDIFIVRAGGRIPADGKIISGSGTADESALTGESMPVDKEAGSSVSAGTLLSSGAVTCRAERVGSDTGLSKIVELVNDASATKAPVAKIADRVAGIFVPAVIVIAAITAVVWLIAGRGAEFAILRGVSVLVISCPCALGLATPVAVMAANGVGAKNGILFKTAAAIENTGKTDIVVLDKTGTVTEGRPRVTDIIPFSGGTEKGLLTLAAALEWGSSHPLAAAIKDKAAEEGIEPPEVTDFTQLAGGGVQAKTGNTVLTGGNLKLIGSKSTLPEEACSAADRLAEEGKTVLFFTEGEKFSGLIAVEDAVKPDCETSVIQLKNLGLRVIMLTGDNEATARAVGKKAGIADIVSGVMPDGKAETVRSLQNGNRVMMVGDGINDAPALTCADTGVAIGAGTDVAIDAADVVLMKSRLSDLPAAIRLSRAALRNIKQNLFWAFFYNCLGIPLAAGVFIPAFGWELNPMFAAAAMSLSSFFVVTNALRLNRFKLYREKKHGGAIKKPRPKIKKESNLMEKTVKIEGMMCEHCEATVRKALESVKGIASVEVSHQTGEANIALSEDVPDSAIVSAVEGAGYKVTAVTPR